MPCTGNGVKCREPHPLSTVKAIVIERAPGLEPAEANRPGAVLINQSR